MRFAHTALIILTTFITFSCQNADPAKDENGGTEIIQDNAYEKGFALTPLLPKTVMQGGGFEKTYLDTLDFCRDGSSPVWHFAQWHSKFNLAHAELQTADDGSVYYINEGGSKKVALYPDNSLLLEVNASKEYDSARVQGQPWPHLLIAQNFHENSPNIGEAAQLLFSMELKL